MKAYQVVTDVILEKLSEGVVPWRKTWASGIPCSLGSGKEYRGINIILLGLKDFTSRYWVTYKEALRLKGFITKGSKGSAVVYWHWRTEEERERMKNDGKSNAPAPCFPFLFTAFNLEQSEGISRPENDLHLKRKDRLEEAEAVIRGLVGSPIIAHAQQLAPCYMPEVDLIQMPHLSQFKSANHYYSTLFHELIHSTGHRSRLNRELKGRDTESVQEYGFEELVAEIGAAFLCALTGIENERTINDQASYIAHWQEFLKGDQSAFMRASSEAQRAVDLVRGISFEAEQDSKKQDDSNAQTISL